jgi:ribonuclease VapC
MIVVDASALIAILDEEADASRRAEAIADADLPLISAATVVEVGIVMLNRHGPKGARSVTSRHAQLALEAYASYGKGRKSAASLNYGDCFSYALAKATGLPLLFKGRDFSGTDIRSVL